jgi:glycosyltransferase involved in cell wall biosynthesis
VEVLPNIVDAEEAARLAAPPPSFPLPDRFVLFVGKLEENKGARLLVPALAASGHKLPLVVLGEGSLAHVVRYEAAAAGIPLVNRGWAEREDVLRTLARAEALVFPALWPEPLSRVLLEALALGIPAAAMDTGGTGEILREGSGLLARDAPELGHALGRLLGDGALRRDTAERARARARAFAPETLVPRYTDVYRRLQ